MIKKNSTTFGVIQGNYASRSVKQLFYQFKLYRRGANFVELALALAMATIVKHPRSTGAYIMGWEGG